MRAALTILAALILAGPVQAQEPDPERGAALFRANCATCHGLSARGDGPMTAILAIEPPDLTLLSAANGDVFPMAQAVRQIDGRDMLAHGGAMPVFGLILEDTSGVVDDASGNPVFTSRAVVDIATYLESIQR